MSDMELVDGQTCFFYVVAKQQPGNEMVRAHSQRVSWTPRRSGGVDGVTVVTDAAFKKKSH